PLKCMWCHEIALPTLVIENRAVQNMLSNDDFVFLRNRIQDRLDKHRLSLVTDMNFAYQPEHVKAELLYITYMEPTLMHLADEWNVSETEAQKKLHRTSSYIFQEFDYIGRVYPRAEIDPLDTINHLEVPESARETGREVNYFVK
ncbi:MAG TPA: hypothetical protein VK826_12160, partial [Bacteroidia bacterium]|nr:hypothetical protein [Bacteroidia bacterium]